MHPNPHPINPFGDPVDQFSGELEFLSRVPAGGKRRSHESAPVALLGHNHLGKNRFVELDKVTSGVTKID